MDIIAELNGEILNLNFIHFCNIYVIICRDVSLNISRNFSGIFDVMFHAVTGKNYSFQKIQSDSKSCLLQSALNKVL